MQEKTIGALKSCAILDKYQAGKKKHLCFICCLLILLGKVKAIDNFIRFLKEKNS